MLKKAGIVVAAAAAGLLAVSPLAFAGEKGYDDHYGKGHKDSGSVTITDDDNTNNAEGDENVGLVNVSGNNVNVPIQACNNNVPIVNLVPVSDITGIVSLLQLGGTNSVQTDESCTQGASAGDALFQGIIDD